MLLTPRYGDPSFLRLDWPADDPSVPLMRQRRRLASILGGLDDDSWAAASRCEGWTVKDVVAHLVTTNQFWAFSVRAGRAGVPTRFLTTFDPVSSPAQLVDAVRSHSTADTLDQFVETNEALAESLSDLDEDGWSLQAEAPPGHVPLRALALHALWDSWVHERDIVLPLGRRAVEETDEIVGSLAYGVALSPAMAVARGETRAGTIVVDAADPAVHVVVAIHDSTLHVRAGDAHAPTDALFLSGPAVELLEALSFRVPLSCPVAVEHQWMLDGLATVFDHEVPSR